MTLSFAPDAIETWPLSRLQPYAKNAKAHGPDQVAKIAASMAEFGWTVPCLVAEDGELIAGHGRVLAATQLGLFATDPPYLVDYDGSNHPTRNKDWSASYGTTWDDSSQGAELYDGFIAAAVAEAITEDAAWYCWHASRRQAMLEACWEKAGAFVHQQIIWVKDRGVLPLVIPSPTLAAAVDPLDVFRTVGSIADAGEMRTEASARLRDLARDLGKRLQPVQRGGMLSGLRNRLTGTTDDDAERAMTWDWACAAALDIGHGSFDAWLAKGEILADIVRTDGQDGWHDHLGALSEAARNDVLHGQADAESLLSHVTELALGSPATCALRALSRVAPGLALDDPEMLSAATRIGMAFRGLFNQPESQALLRGDTDDVYWQSVLTHCVDHDLQSVLDEYLHVLLESEGLMDEAPSIAVAALAEKIDEALSLKPAQIDIKRYRTKGDRLQITSEIKMRGRFATRLLQKGQEDGAQRTDTVRMAFNSPFKPFVLASTSVGQEGLDFHPYCHRLVHWNLPSNPVDLEQREGRVHRYKNHAVRLNLASRFVHALGAPDATADPWRSMFDMALLHAERPGDMEPFWLLDGETNIERYALSLPYSRESSLLGWLKRSVAVYRLAFGQPRQDDLMAFLENIDTSNENIDLTALQISLRPV